MSAGWSPVDAGRAPGAGWSPPLVPARFAAAAAAYPEATALVQGGQRWDYAATAGYAGRLARYLRGPAAVTTEQPVAVAATRTPEMVGAVLGVLWAGAAYLPFDPAEPPGRLAAMLAETRTRVVIGPPELAAVAGDQQLIRPDAPELLAHAGPGTATPDPALVPPDALAYVIYTSGSTGRPKPVAVSHRALANLIDWSTARFQVRPGDAFLQFARLTFDVSVWEILTPLCAGATVVVADHDDVLSPAALAALIARHQITHLDLPAAILEAMPLPQLPSLRFCAAGAEPVPARTVRHAAGPGRTVINSYGPTEVTEVAVLAVCDPDDPAPPPIGRTVPGVTGHILDERLCPVPAGVTGELYLGGRQVARGYLGQPALTARRFVPDPWADPPGGRLYRTGDLVRARPDGQWEFVGRRDRQVKIRGIRVEPAELELALRGQAEVTEAAVTTGRLGASRRLVAHVVGPVAPEALRRRLAGALPAHLLPAAVLVHVQLPRTGHGKVDYVRLEQLAAAGATGAEAEPAAPADGRRLLRQAVQEVLGMAPDPAASLLQLGGDSLDAMRIVTRLRSGGHSLDVRELLRPVPLAELLPAPAPAPPPLADAPPTEPPALTPNQLAMWYHQLLIPASTAYHIPVRLELTGPLEVDRLLAAWRLVVARHDSLRTRVGRQGVRAVLLTDAPPPAVTVHDLSAWDAADRQRRAGQLRGALPPFPLAEAVPIRCDLLRHSGTHHELVITVHHLICDGWSLAVLVEDLAAAYRNLAGTSAAGQVPAGQAPPAGHDPPAPASFAAYADWQQAQVAAGRYQAGVRYWRDLLADSGDRLATRATGAATAVAIGRIFDLDELATASLRRLARGAGTTMFVVLLTGFARALADWFDTGSLIIGAVYANRPHPSLERTIGQFVNTVPIPVDVDSGSGWDSTGEHVRRLVAQSLPYWEVPLPMITEQLGGDRTPYRVGGPWHALFEFDNAPVARFAAGELRGAFSEDGLQQGAVSELSLRVFARASGGAGLRAVLVADSGIFDAAHLAEIAHRTIAAWRRLGAGLGPPAPDGPKGHSRTVARHQVGERNR